MKAITEIKSASVTSNHLVLQTVRTGTGQAISIDIADIPSFKSSLAGLGLKRNTLRDLDGLVFTWNILKESATPIVYHGRTVSDIFSNANEPDSITTLINASVIPMHAGDYQWITTRGQRVLVERKTIVDLLGSLSRSEPSPIKEKEPRLVVELRKCREQADIVILLLEGTLEGKNTMIWTGYGTGKNGKGIKWPASSVSLILLEMQISLGVYIYWSESLEATPNRLLALRNWLDKGKYAFTNAASMPWLSKVFQLDQ